MLRSDKKWETLFYYKKEGMKRYGGDETGYRMHVGGHKFTDGNALGIATRIEEPIIGATNKPATLLTETLSQPAGDDGGGFGVELAHLVAAVVVLGVEARSSGPPRTPPPRPSPRTATAPDDENHAETRRRTSVDRRESTSEPCSPEPPAPRTAASGRLRQNGRWGPPNSPPRPPRRRTRAVAPRTGRRIDGGSGPPPLPPPFHPRKTSPSPIGSMAGKKREFGCRRGNLKSVSFKRGKILWRRKAATFKD
nr:hypothetical protein Iba_scaffold89277CG0010 [Ipomoea batatas]